MLESISRLTRKPAKLMLRYVSGCLSLIQKWALQLRGARFEGSVRLPVWLEPVIHPETLTFGEGAALDQMVTLLATNESARIVLGKRCYINRCTMFDASESIEIGDDTMIGPHCYITDHDHTFGPGISPGQSPLVSSPTRIGQRCWIGAHVTILKGVTIGDGTVVGAGSVVTKSLPAGVVAAGVPARIIRDMAD